LRIQLGAGCILVDAGLSRTWRLHRSVDRRINGRSGRETDIAIDNRPGRGIAEGFGYDRERTGRPKVRRGLGKCRYSQKKQRYTRGRSENQE